MRKERFWYGVFMSAVMAVGVIGMSVGEGSLKVTAEDTLSTVVTADVYNLDNMYSVDMEVKTSIDEDGNTKMTFIPLRSLTFTLEHREGSMGTFTPVYFEIPILIEVQKPNWFNENYQNFSRCSNQIYVYGNNSSATSLKATIERNCNQPSQTWNMQENVPIFELEFLYSNTKIYTDEQGQKFIKNSDGTKDYFNETISITVNNQIISRQIGTGASESTIISTTSKGDINSDGFVNAVDAALILTYAADYGAGAYSGTIEDWYKQKC